MLVVSWSMTWKTLELRPLRPPLRPRKEFHGKALGIAEPADHAW